MIERTCSVIDVSYSYRRKYFILIILSTQSEYFSFLAFWSTNIKSVHYLSKKCNCFLSCMKSWGPFIRAIFAAILRAIFFSWWMRRSGQLRTLWFISAVICTSLTYPLVHIYQKMKIAGMCAIHIYQHGRVIQTYSFEVVCDFYKIRESVLSRNIVDDGKRLKCMVWNLQRFASFCENRSRSTRRMESAWQQF